MNPIQEAVKQSLTLLGPTFVEIDELLFHETMEELQRQGLFVVQIDTDPIRTFDDLFNAFYEKCSFPEWFGFNQAALKDILLNTEYLPPRGYIFAFSNIHIMEDLPLLMFIKYFTMMQQIREEEIKDPLKLLLPSNPNNRIVQAIVDNTLEILVAREARKQQESKKL